jgi:hypothetical protein
MLGFKIAAECTAHATQFEDQKGIFRGAGPRSIAGRLPMQGMIGQRDDDRKNE